MTEKSSGVINPTEGEKSSDSPPWPSEWGQVVMGLLATGLLELTQHLERKNTFLVPYPMSLQRALDRLTVMAMVAGAPAPRSAMELVEWAHLPFSAWPYWPPTEGMSGSETLLLRGRPSKTCLEWSVISGDVEGEVRERLLIRQVMDICQAHKADAAYVAFRKLLVETPAMGEQELVKRMASPDLALVAQFLRSAYRSAPPEAVVSGEALICAGCGNLWVIDQGGLPRCQEWDCPEPGAVKNRLPISAGVVWLSRELRAFICGPGRAELRIATALNVGGVDTLLWPNFDACDLLPKAVPWAADVKSWVNPVRLAWRLNERPFVVPREAERGFIVIAKEQTVGRPEYLRTLRNHCAWLKTQSRVEVVTERTYVERVLKEAARRSA